MPAFQAFTLSLDHDFNHEPRIFLVIEEGPGEHLVLGRASLLARGVHVLPGKRLRSSL
ncbi:hypothetical protein [Nannocystis pusilla]|uniref:hypothetical protein n=1 Tax=Nannocystis pusilla TaxID=889268 RepID=UPI003B7F6C1A